MMRPDDCKEIETDLWRYVDRELPAKELGVISGHLRDCAACRRSYEEKAREVKLYRLGFDRVPFGESFVGRFQRRFAEEELSTPRGSVVLRGRSWWDGLRSRVLFATGVDAAAPARSVRWLATAALVLLIPGLVFLGVYLSTPPVDFIGTYTVSAGNVKYMIENGSRGRRLASGSSYPLRPGSRFEVERDGRLEIVLEDESSERARLDMKGPAIFEIPSTASLASFAAELRAGRLDVEVEPLPDGESFAVATPDAVARVVGTRFALEVLDAATRLEVEEGIVSFASKHVRDDVVGREVEVRAGEVSRVDAQGARPEPARPPEGDVPAAAPGGADTVPVEGTAASSPPGAAGEAGTEASRGTSDPPLPVDLPEPPPRDPSSGAKKPAEEELDQPVSPGIPDEEESS